MHLATLVGSIISSHVYTAHGWLVAPTMAGISAIPLLFLPKVNNIIQDYLAEIKKPEDDGAGNTDNDIKTEGSANLTTLRKITILMPDLAVFMNNMMYIVMIYILPYQLVEYAAKSIETAALLLTIVNALSFVTSLVLGPITEKLNTFTIMIVGNAMFYLGLLLAYGSTTKVFKFSSSFEIGCILIGIGDPGVLNMGIMSKFVLYKNWGIMDKDLGVRSTKLNNLALCVSGVLGVALPGLLISIDKAFLGIVVACWFITNIALVMCKLVK